MTTSAASQASLPRGRRTARPSGDDRELAILATAENLLEDRPLADISVDDLAKGAGISRPTFYFYFPSKEAVLLTLLDRVVNQADMALQTLAENPADTDRENMWRTGINVFFETFVAQGGNLSRSGRQGNQCRSRRTVVDVYAEVDRLHGRRDRRRTRPRRGAAHPAGP